MNYSTKCNWSTGYQTIPGQVKLPTSQKVMPKEVILKLMRESKSGGRFKCPNCKVTYSADYSTFGHMSFFEADTLYCKDCGKLSGFTKANR